jgi:Pyruvate/2-oxoacid:ferredoxin oxidoreductase gamma subunit
MLNVALLGALSARLPMTEQAWLDAVASAFDQKFLDANRQAFLLGRAGQNKDIHAFTDAARKPVRPPDGFAAMIDQAAQSP